MAKLDEKTIKKLMDSLGITREEAIETLQFDNDEIDNEEAATLETQAKNLNKETGKEKTKKGSSLDKVKNQRAKKKADTNKESIIDTIKNFVTENELFINPQNLTASKITFKDKDGAYYSITITKHKVKPDGYSEE